MKIMQSQPISMIYSSLCARLH